MLIWKIAKYYVDSCRITYFSESFRMPLKTRHTRIHGRTGYRTNRLTLIIVVVTNRLNSVQLNWKQIKRLTLSLSSLLWPNLILFLLQFDESRAYTKQINNSNTGRAQQIKWNALESNAMICFFTGIKSPCDRSMGIASGKNVRVINEAHTLAHTHGALKWIALEWREIVNIGFYNRNNNI